MHAEEEKKVKGKRKEKKKRKEEKYFFFFFFFISPCACFFIYAQWSFFKYKKKTISRLRGRSNPLLFVIKILIVSQFGDLYINLMIHCFAHFDSESLWKHNLLQD